MIGTSRDITGSEGERRGTTFNFQAGLVYLDEMMHAVEDDGNVIIFEGLVIDKQSQDHQSDCNSF